jgi:hypothetical protein
VTAKKPASARTSRTNPASRGPGSGPPDRGPRIAAPGSRPGLDIGYGVFIYADRWGHGGGDPGFEMLAHRMPKQDATMVALCNVEGLAGDVRDLLVETVHVTA